MTKLLNGVKRHLESGAYSMLKQFANDGMDKDELSNMFSQVAEIIHTLKNTTSFCDFVKLLYKDQFAVIGYCSEGLDDLLDDIEYLIK